MKKVAPNQMLIACDALKRLSKIWRSRDISPSTKVKVYETLVLSILLYNAETWTLTAELNKILRVFEMSCLRLIAGLTRQDLVRNEVTQSYLKIKRDIVEKLELFWPRRKNEPDSLAIHCHAWSRKMDAEEEEDPGKGGSTP